jgi:hypothetical protein
LYSPSSGHFFELDFSSSEDSDDTDTVEYSPLDAGVVSCTLEEDYVESSGRRNSKLLSIQDHNETFGQWLREYHPPVTLASFSLMAAPEIGDDKQSRSAMLNESREQWKTRITEKASSIEHKKMRTKRDFPGSVNSQVSDKPGRNPQKDIDSDLRRRKLEQFRGTRDEPRTANRGDVKLGAKAKK